MIQSFANKDTQELFQRESNRRFSSIARVALRKPVQMNRARVLQDLAVPPGNRLEALKGSLASANPRNSGTASKSSATSAPSPKTSRSSPPTSSPP
jgi:hypothetical protein